MEYDGDGDTSYNCYSWNDPQRLNKRAGGVGNRQC